MTDRPDAARRRAAWTAPRGRLRRLALLAAGLAAASAACGGGATPSPPAGLRTPAPGASSAPLFVAIYPVGEGGASGRAAGFEARVRELGGRAATYDARRDPRLAVSLVREAIAAGAAGITITAPDGSIGPAVAELAAAARVPLVATDARLLDRDGLPVPWVGIDDGDLGAAVGEAATALLAARRWDLDEVGVLAAEVQSLASCNARTGRARQALVDAGVPPGNVVPVAYSGEVASARDAAAPLIAANPQLTRWVAIGCNDQGVQGALDALAAGRIDLADAIGVGLGADLACRAWAGGAPTGFRAAVFVYGGDVGAAAAEALWAASRDGLPPAGSTVHGTLVTPETWRDVVPASFAEACAGSATGRE